MQGFRVLPLERAMANGEHELNELAPSELSEVSGGSVAAETAKLEGPCKTPSPAGPIPIPYPLQFDR